ncbi:hypothetical protein TIFTF001_031874 [Ficus carica]|uniref:Uncharacterized protein n=1 Tax=Ficus carica TaxID=3494 RepID=A0AA88J4W7_FICCA|nr:hypothetical protein TIFTF001_031874 [Ficus carica]
MGSPQSPLRVHSAAVSRREQNGDLDFLAQIWATEVGLARAGVESTSPPPCPPVLVTGSPILQPKRHHRRRCRGYSDDDG